ncbi:FtsB family cell division protein [Actinomyces trachealis]|uniref:FtsB family cell division protein n=1 Tax=Actinomyces trachealis TaxID=2763540 RepID=UPI001892CE3A|nr:septum formation initiator family protein [Actinomyces trachealis]
MSPRRPAPARPGNRLGTSRRAPGTKASPAAKTTRRETSARPADAEHNSKRTPTTVRTATSPGRLRIGGNSGFTVSYRLVTLVLVLAFAAMIVGPAARQFLIQRAEYADAKKELAKAQATQSALAQELAKWDDDAYARSQARERLGYVMPGETSYVVVGAEELETKQNTDGDASPSQSAEPWYVTLTDSVREASRPRPTASPTATPAPSGTPTTPATSTAPTVPTLAPTEGPSTQETP